MVTVYPSLFDCNLGIAITQAWMLISHPVIQLQGVVIWGIVKYGEEPFLPLLIISTPNRDWDVNQHIFSLSLPWPLLECPTVNRTGAFK